MFLNMSMINEQRTVNDAFADVMMGMAEKKQNRTQPNNYTNNWKRLIDSSFLWNCASLFIFCYLVQFRFNRASSVLIFSYFAEQTQLKICQQKISAMI